MTEASFSSADARSNTRRYAVLGILFGLAFPFVAMGVELAAAGLPFTMANLASLHAQPTMWIVDTAPIVLGAFAAFAGRRQDLLEATSRVLADQAQELQGGQQVLEQRIAERTRFDNGPANVQRSANNAAARPGTRFRNWNSAVQLIQRCSWLRCRHTSWTNEARRSSSLIPGSGRVAVRG
jgi:hypothetical protein